jgi:pimeloyl-ACP methyl ester carboxylesterase
LGRALPVPVSLHPREGARAVPAVTGRYVPVTVSGVTYQIYSESVGSGQDVLCMHTAGADGRQFHGLMADPRIVEHHRLISFDLPWHGKSRPPEGAIHGSWRLNTALYVALIMGFVAAAGLEKPVALGASMSGEICLELAYRHPEAFVGIIACEACDKIDAPDAFPGIPLAGIEGDVAEEDLRAALAVVPHDLFHVFGGALRGGEGAYPLRHELRLVDLRVHRPNGLALIDTNRCRLFMLTGEYDYSCTVELSEATAAKIPGVRFQAMQGIGHFLFAENPKRFAEYLLPILAELK